MYDEAKARALQSKSSTPTRTKRFFEKYLRRRYRIARVGRNLNLFNIWERVDGGTVILRRSVTIPFAPKNTDANAVALLRAALEADRAKRPFSVVPLFSSSIEEWE
jgi:hypothetical protein